MTAAASKIDIDSLVATDVHTHAEVSEATGCGALSPELQDAADQYFAKTHIHRPPAVSEMAQYYRERKMMAVVFTVDAATTTMACRPCRTTRSQRRPRTPTR